jgi:hypothetical protein
MEDHSDSDEHKERYSKLANVRDSLDLIICFIDQTSDAAMQPCYEHLKTVRRMSICQQEQRSNQ